MIVVITMEMIRYCILWHNVVTPNILLEQQWEYIPSCLSSITWISPCWNLFLVIRSQFSVFLTKHLRKSGIVLKKLYNEKLTKLIIRKIMTMDISEKFIHLYIFWMAHYCIFVLVYKGLFYFKRKYIFML